MKKIQNLSSEVKSIATQVMAIRDDLDITRAQEKEKLQQLRAGLPKEVLKEIKKLFPAEKHRQRGKVSRKHQHKQSP
uniref:Uncharacterized protein n=1 Tax=Acrobeloides nanus TaxID=290746 RepID=A0A914BXY5_9BILA